jgi:hypothetical protein
MRVELRQSYTRETAYYCALFPWWAGPDYLDPVPQGPSSSLGWRFQERYMAVLCYTSASPSSTSTWHGRLAKPYALIRASSVGHGAVRWDRIVRFVCSGRETASRSENLVFARLPSIFLRSRPDRLLTHPSNTYRILWCSSSNLRDGALHGLYSINMICSS